MAVSFQIIASRHAGLGRDGYDPSRLVEGGTRIVQGKYTKPLDRPRSDGVMQTLVAAGLEIIDESGIDAMTVRSLAVRTYYSASTVGYHTTPMRLFVSRLWHEICSDLLAASMPDPGSDHWSTRAASQMLEWTRTRPNHTRFFVSFSPDRLQPHPLLQFDQFGVVAADHEGRLDEVMHFLVRRLQSAIELALSTPHRPDAISLLARSLHADWKFWTDGHAALPAPS